jgi:hypothetical protein
MPFTIRFLLHQIPELSIKAFRGLVATGKACASNVKTVVAERYENLSRWALESCFVTVCAGTRVLGRKLGERNETPKLIGIAD